MDIHAPALRIGLRFDRRDARPLAVLAERAKLRELGEQGYQIFASASEAARTGEPLIVECATRLEAELIAAGYVRFGVRHPVLEQLS